MKKLEITKEKIVIFILSGIFAFLVSNNIFHLQDVLTFSAPIVGGIALSLVLGFLLFQAGLVVIKSLVFVAAELSLIIFLAQSYCAPEVARTTSGDSALVALVAMGLLYVMYRFLTDVYKELKDLAKKFKAVDGKWSREAVFMFFLLLVFTVLFVVMVFEVIGPIVTGLCVYK